MMNINDNNYELWLLRYAEQELSSAERAEVERWLATHPEAAEELALYSEAPRLERNAEVRYVATALQHTEQHTDRSPLWGAAWRWAAAAAVVLALMLPALRSVPAPSPLPLMAAIDSIPELPETPDIPEKPEPTKPTARPVRKAPAAPQPEPLLATAEPELPEPSEQPETPEEPEAPTPLYVDDLIVYVDEPEQINEVTYTTTAGDGINPVALFIGTLIKTTK